LLEVNIPAGTSTTDQAFYLARLWQSPAPPPIAGLRIRRGQDRTATVVVRGDGRIRADPGGKNITSGEFPPDQ
jgi:hypothetical protein